MSEVKFDSDVGDLYSRILVDKYIAEAKRGDTITFTNELEGGAVVELTFYSDRFKQTQARQLCRIVEDGAPKIVDTVRIENKSSVECTLMKGEPYEWFLYKIEPVASDTLDHLTLDPVIIIQPDRDRDDDPVPGPGVSPELAIGAAILIAIIAAALGFNFGRRTTS